MNRELYLYELRQLRDGCKAEHMDTETAALDAAIQTLSCEGDCISRQAAIDEIQRFTGYIDQDMINRIQIAIGKLPSAQPEDWMEQNKDRILKAGMEGREVEFRIGGRLFAIREKAQ